MLKLLQREKTLRTGDMALTWEAGRTQSTIPIALPLGAMWATLPSSVAAAMCWKLFPTM
jgi:hypothetical protein